MMSDLDVLLREAGGAQNRLRVVAQQLLDLGIANERNAGRKALRARGAGATATVACRDRNAVSSASACAAGVLRRALIGLPSIMSVRDRKPHVQPN